MVFKFVRMLKNIIIKDMLSDNFIKRIKRLKKKLEGLDRVSIKTTLKNFEHDINPEDELMKWEALALGVTRAFRKHPEWDNKIKLEKYFLAVTLLLGTTFENSREYTRYVHSRNQKRIKDSIKILQDHLDSN